METVITISDLRNEVQDEDGRAWLAQLVRSLLFSHKVPVRSSALLLWEPNPVCLVAMPC
mgnify:CR=1 FL=1